MIGHIIGRGDEGPARSETSLVGRLRIRMRLVFGCLYP